MDDKDPSILQMIRAQFLIGIVIPLSIGTLTAISISGSFHFEGFLLILLVGLGLHMATDVYNDIYDTKQGADQKMNERRNYFSGGSGILLQKPHLMTKMYLLARFGLILSFLAMIGLLFFIDRSLWFYVIILYVLSAFFSKYYTAAPIKFGYRGFGEVLVWLSFGPIAIALAGFSQNMMIHGIFYPVMPTTGLSTLTILWVGQMVDLPNDKAAGKLGLVARIGTKRAYYSYFIIQFLLICNILYLAFFVFTPGWPLLIALIPFILLPKIWNILKKRHAHLQKFTQVTTFNTIVYILFSFLFNLGIWLTLLLKS
jgi:1,4-dihydroxy-2-naphthoate polyprenyltransferase